MKKETIRKYINKNYGLKRIYDIFDDGVLGEDLIIGMILSVGYEIGKPFSKKSLRNIQKYVGKMDKEVYKHFQTLAH